jgi:hypothetical protein
MSSRAHDDFLAEARAAPVVDYAWRLGVKALRDEQGGPCPCCGGTDRFAVNGRKNLWLCRASGAGGDAIALAQHVKGLDFLGACEEVLGRPAPERERRESDEERRAREQAFARRVEAAHAEQEQAAAAFNKYREAERRRAHDLWTSARAARGAPVEQYLSLRGLTLPDGARLKFMPRAALWNASWPNGKVIHRGPTMIAAMAGPDGKFAGAHLTYLDLARPKGKAEIVDPDTGEVADAKKTRGSWKGASIMLARAEREPTRLFIGEGIETVLSMREALRRAGSPLLDGAEFRSSVNLGNIAGKAAGSVAHPTLKAINKAGREYTVRVPCDEIPDAEPWPVIPVPSTVRELYLLGDGDSDPFTTGMALRRAAKRFSRAYPFLSVRIAMAAPGMDFNDMLLASEHRSAAE